MADSRFRVLFSDIGGVLGTNGWDGRLRREIIEHFGADGESIESRHRLMFDSYERGFIQFDEYLRRVFFGRPRLFTLEQVRDYAFNASTPWPENIEFVKRVKALNGFKLALISNEGQGITEHRVVKFGLREFADFMVISHFVHMRKPDPEIWRLALDLAQAKPSECIYIDDRPLFAEVAAGLGFTAIHHSSLDSTRAALRDVGVTVD